MPLTVPPVSPHIMPVAFGAAQKADVVRSDSATTSDAFSGVAPKQPSSVAEMLKIWEDWGCITLLHDLTQTPRTPSGPRNYADTKDNPVFNVIGENGELTGEDLKIKRGKDQLTLYLGNNDHGVRWVIPLRQSRWGSRLNPDRPIEITTGPASIGQPNTAQQAELQQLLSQLLKTVRGKHLLLPWTSPVRGVMALAQ